MLISKTVLKIEIKAKNNVLSTCNTPKNRKNEGNEEKYQKRPPLGPLLIEDKDKDLEKCLLGLARRFCSRIVQHGQIQKELSFISDVDRSWT